MKELGNLLLWMAGVFALLGGVVSILGLLRDRDLTNVLVTIAIIATLGIILRGVEWLVQKHRKTGR